MCLTDKIFLQMHVTCVLKESPAQGPLGIPVSHRGSSQNTCNLMYSFQAWFFVVPFSLAWSPYTVSCRSVSSKVQNFAARLRDPVEELKTLHASPWGTSLASSWVVHQIQSILFQNNQIFLKCTHTIPHPSIFWYKQSQNLPFFTFLATVEILSGVSSRNGVILFFFLFWVCKQLLKSTVYQLVVKAHYIQ